MNCKFTSNELDGEEIEVNGEIKYFCSQLDSYITDNVNDCRERSIALTKLEECAMWATKALAFHGVVGAKTHTVE